MMEIDLPDLIELNDSGGNWNRYIEAVYEAFKKDFVLNKPSFRGQKLGLKHHPAVNGKAYTFYHMTHSGRDEANREPDLRRCERIPWAKPTIEQCDKWNLKVWEQKRNGELRICIWLELQNEPDYIIILNKRKGYFLPWTAFVMEYEHEKKKKQREYEKWLKKARGAR
ncbi:MAG: hypothetical protein WD267_04155 [Balneolales bacterium]